MMIKIMLGVVTIPLGVVIWGWILYNLLVERVAGYNGVPAPAMLFASALLVVGGRWVKQGWNERQGDGPDPPMKKNGVKRTQKKQRVLKPLQPLDEL